MTDKVLEIGDADFEKEVIKSDLPVLVDFWAPWCGPCRAMTPIIDKLNQKFAGKVKIAKCNIDDNPITPGKYGVKAIPTLMFFKDGNLMEQITGMMPEPKLEELINKMIG